MKNLLKQKKCYNKPDNTSCIDLILTNCYRSFQNANVFKTELFDFHKMTYLILNHLFLRKSLILLFTAAIKNYVITHLEMTLVMNC